MTERPSQPLSLSHKEEQTMTPKKDEYMRGYGDGFKDGAAVKVKPLEWRDHRPDSFPEPAWSAQTPFGFYNLVEASASDSPRYVVHLHGHHFVADKDSLDEAKDAAQADYEKRIRAALIADAQVQS